MKVALVGSPAWQSTRKVQAVFRKLKTLPEPVTILGQGGTEGIGPMIKKYALDFGFAYAEYNPSFSGHNLYSAMPESYYGKPYHFSQLVHRMNLIAQAADRMMIFCSETPLELQSATAWKRMQKLEKPVTIVA